MFYSHSSRKTTLAHLRRGLLEDRAIYIAIGFFSILGLIYVALRGEFSLATFFVYTMVWVLNYGFVFPLLLAIYLTCRIILKLDRRRALAARLVMSPANAGRMLAGTVLMFGILPFNAVFTNFKNALSQTDGFPWDPFFANFDKALHFGIDPGPFLTAHFHSKFFLEAIEFNYNTLWFVVCFSILYWYAIAPAAKERRVRYVICFLLVWAIIGGLFAAIFVSAGPAYYGEVTGNLARFGDQMRFIASSDNVGAGAYHYQRYLWLLRSAGQQALGTGISAFPSVHVGLIAMNAVFLFEYNRKLGYFGLAYTALVMFSSVYLGWHYAVDGYASVALVLAIYFGVKAVFNRKWIWRFGAASDDAEPALAERK